MPRYIPRIQCPDGESVSVQASGDHYCSPRNWAGPYTAVEAGYPSCTPPYSWLEYADTMPVHYALETGAKCCFFDGPTVSYPAQYTESVYGWLPTPLVLEFMVAHGWEAEAARAYLSEWNIIVGREDV